ncbi:MAG: glutathione S-transferase family protein [Solirubrobacteraceae bacterium]
MDAVLYFMAISHPCQAARKMLDVKGMDYRVVKVRAGAQRIQLRLAGFPRGTVPAIRLDGRRVQGTRAISRALDEACREPALFPSQPELRALVTEAERWGEEELQPIPRRLFRFMVAHDRSLQSCALRSQGLPSAAPLSAAIGLVSSYFARTIEADGRRATEAAVRADLAALPAMLDRVDRLLADGTLSLHPPNAATLQVLSSIHALLAFDDLAGTVGPHACAEPALELFGPNPAQVPHVLAPSWLVPLAER